MRIQRIAVSGFRGFRDLVEVPLAPSFTVIDGRNGVGKSTVFDAIEFVLTGQITKYGDMKASGETVENYIWWKGDGHAPKARYAEVTFYDETGSITLRRTPIEEPAPADLARVEAGMVNAGLAPASPLTQLCAASIIRDENIASLSLDLTETQRYAKLRQAIGASDADTWIERANRLLNAAKRRSEQARSEVGSANNAIAEASRRIDEARAALAPETAVTEAAGTLSTLLRVSHAAPDQLISPARELVARLEAEAKTLAAIVDGWARFQSDATAVAESERALDDAQRIAEDAEADRALLPAPADDTSVGARAELVRELHELRSLGQRIGLIDNHCPLCAADHDHASFQTGLKKAGEIIDRIDREASERAAEAARRRDAITAADRRITEARQRCEALRTQLTAQRQAIAGRRTALESAGLDGAATMVDASDALGGRNGDLERAKHALRILGTLAQNRQLETGAAALTDAQTRLARAQDRAGKARKAEAAASALHDAARRAGSETLDLRLERVLPLMAELYGRLRPHPVWQDIEYSIRGDLRRFLSLQVGDGLNPQFLFSSGQRRATGLAFLLSINLSLAWSRWQTILLDDPVQHVDDFRTVNLAEVLAQLVAGGRQIVVAVEDPALAELLARRMPVARPGDAIRLTLGLGPAACPDIIDHHALMPLAPRVLAAA